MSEYRPGTVAVATVRGVEGVRVMRTTGTKGGDDIWLTVAHVGGWRSHTREDVTDIRPLVVLDLDGHDFAANIDDIREALDEYDVRLGPGTALSMFEAIAEQIEAQVKPSRIPEPGLWGVVEASPSKGSPTPRKWVRYGTGWRDAFANHLEWDDLIDPSLIREGVES